MCPCKSPPLLTDCPPHPRDGALLPANTVMIACRDPHPQERERDFKHRSDDLFPQTRTVFCPFFSHHFATFPISPFLMALMRLGCFAILPWRIGSSCSIASTIAFVAGIAVMGYSGPCFWSIRSAVSLAYVSPHSCRILVPSKQMP